MGSVSSAWRRGDGSGVGASRATCPPSDSSHEKCPSGRRIIQSSFFSGRASGAVTAHAGQRHVYACQHHHALEPWRPSGRRNYEVAHYTRVSGDARGDAPCSASGSCAVGAMAGAGGARAHAARREEARAVLALGQGLVVAGALDPGPRERGARLCAEQQAPQRSGSPQREEHERGLVLLLAPQEAKLTAQEGLAQEGGRQRLGLPRVDRP